MKSIRRLIFVLIITIRRQQTFYHSSAGGGGGVLAFQPPLLLLERIDFLRRSLDIITIIPFSMPAPEEATPAATMLTSQQKQQVQELVSSTMNDDQMIVRCYAGVFLEKMLEELNTGHNKKGVEHVYRNLSLFLSPPVTAVDGGGVPLAQLRDALEPRIVARYDALSLNGARLADAILSELPSQGQSLYDPMRILIPRSTSTSNASSSHDEQQQQQQQQQLHGLHQPSQQVDAIFVSIWSKTSLENFKILGGGG